MWYHRFKYPLVVLFWLISSSEIIAQETGMVQEFYFHSGDTLLTNYSQRKLTKFIEKAIEAPYFVTKLKVYSDTIGSFEYNQKLSNMRLKAISHQLQPLMAEYTTECILGKQYDSIKYPIDDLQKWRRIEIYYQLTHVISQVDTASQSVKDTLIVSDSSGSVNLSQSVESEATVNINSIFDTLVGDVFNQAFNLDIQFLTNTDVLLSKSYDEIKSLANYLERNPGLDALIRGHVCCAPNKKISKKRANKVYKALIVVGIDKKRLSFKGMSNTEPAVFPEESEADRQKNRRVDVVFSPR
jgi:outer membrane protein OmpA-like peptidoglycan-associated protein